MASLGDILPLGVATDLQSGRFGLEKHAHAAELLVARFDKPSGRLGREIAKRAREKGLELRRHLPWVAVGGPPAAPREP